MSNSALTFKDSQQAWSVWQLQSFLDRKNVLFELAHHLKKSATEKNHFNQFADIMFYHLEQAQRLIGKEAVLPGPTGESNELYATSRGVALIVFESDKENTQALFAQLTAALIAGNSVMIMSDDEFIHNQLHTALLQNGLLAHLVTMIGLDKLDDVLNCDIRTVGCIASHELVIEINQKLAQRQGVIVPLYLSLSGDINGIYDPAMCLRFICEKTRSINITAVGGNTQLLAQSSAEEQ